MPTLANANVPSPKSWDEFEDILLSAAKLRWSSTDFFRHGRGGQSQQGVDIFGRDAEGRHVGVQGKNTMAGLTKSVVVDEIKMAEDFDPALDALYIGTTAKRDAAIQKVVRNISDERRSEGKFTVGILFWDDVLQDLAKDESEFFKHYPQLRIHENPAKAHDLRLFEALTLLLASDGVIGFLERTNMAGWSFDLGKLDPLNKFYYEWNRPEMEFVDSELDTLRRELWSNAEKYLHLIASETFPLRGNIGRQSVPEEWEFEQPDRFNRVVTTLHTLAGKIVDLHAKLIRTGRSYFLKDLG